MFNACPSTGQLHEAEQLVTAVSQKEQPVLFEDLTREAQAELLQYVFDDETPIEWTDDTIVRLHFMLLDDCAKLGARREELRSSNRVRAIRGTPSRAVREGVEAGRGGAVTP